MRKFECDFCGTAVSCEDELKVLKEEYGGPLDMCSACNQDNNTYLNLVRAELMKVEKERVKEYIKSKRR